MSFFMKRLQSFTKYQQKHIEFFSFYLGVLITEKRREYLHTIDNIRDLSKKSV